MLHFFTLSKLICIHLYFPSRPLMIVNHFTTSNCWVISIIRTSQILIYYLQLSHHNRLLFPHFPTITSINTDLKNCSRRRLVAISKKHAATMTKDSSAGGAAQFMSHLFSRMQFQLCYIFTIHSLTLRIFFLLFFLSSVLQ